MQNQITKKIPKLIDNVSIKYDIINDDDNFYNAISFDDPIRINKDDLLIDAVKNLIKDREFLQYQLSHANGLISDEDLEIIINKYLVPAKKVNINELAFKFKFMSSMIKEDIEIDLISKIFNCDIDDAFKIKEFSKNIYYA